MHDFQDAFISYGRADSKGFAMALYQRLVQQGIKVWFDQNDIPLAVDFQNQIDDGIEKSDNFLYIISPHSVNSPYCLKEIEMAIRHRKRIIPLLHVEQIDRPIWQARNPTGSDDDWESYQSRGLHSGFTNMHSQIGKLNWIYFREGIENFDESFEQLVTLFDRHRDYVKQHTYFLDRALAWERHQKQSAYLLTGEECRAGEDWLKLRFKQEQPPCIPTDLHCEYVTESIKNTNNLMTEVFLCYAEEDLSIAQQIRRTLMRQSFTVWTNKTDIQMGMAFQEAIDRGIEEADNLVYLLSPSSLKSAYCQHELDYAISLNKRIIPILIEKTSPSQIPPTLQKLQYIDLTDNLIEADYQQDESQLIRVLRQDAAYFEQHKRLLANAIKWQQQNCNDSLLLRGYNLRHAEAWLRVAKSNRQYPPTQQQQALLQASLESPSDRSIDVFIAYSRVDSDFARRLNHALQIQGKVTWFDQESIASGAEFQREIFRGIEASNHFVFIISPSSIASEYCIDEIEYAKKLNKRVIPVLYQPIATIDLPKPLAGIQWIDFNRHQRDFLSNFGELVRTLDVDEEQARSHTRLLVRAMQWETEGRDPSFLLRGKELKDAEQWLRVAATKQPKPTDLQRNYITISRRSPLPKPHRLTVGLASLGAGLLVMVMRLMGWLQPIELAAYDQFLRWKPSEPKDERLLLIEIDDEDVKIQNKVHPVGVRGGSLADPGLAGLINKLQQAKAKVIGVDIYRDFATDQPGLRQDFQTSANLVMLCQLGSETADGVSPPPELPEPAFSNRLGFSDLAFDQETAFNQAIFNQSGTIRRHVLIDTPNPSTCPTENAFSLTIARQYLATLGLEYRPPFSPDGMLIQDLQLGQYSIQRLTPYSAAYFDTSVGGGYQTLLNYRKYRGQPHRFIDRVKLRDVLDDRVPTDKIRDRIVLIGVTARASANDYAITPVGELPGVIIQAQMVSQLTSAVLDRRPLIWWLPFWGDALWIFGWSFAGGAIVWMIHRPRSLVILWSLAVMAVYWICYGIFILKGGWLPMVPAALAIVATGGLTLAWNLRPAPFRLRSARTRSKRFIPGLLPNRFRNDPDAPQSAPQRAELESSELKSPELKSSEPERSNPS